MGRDHASAVFPFVKLSQLRIVTAAQSADLILAALDRERSCRNAWSRARALAAFAPHLTPEQIAEALAAAKAIGDERARADTRAVQHYLGHKNIQHTVRYTELSPERFESFWDD
jgi:site-specific recombinase XerC